MNQSMKDILGLLLLVVAIIALGACTSQAGSLVSQDPLAQAAAEATTLVQQAQATALLLKAQAQATAVMQQAELYSSTPMPEPTVRILVSQESAEGNQPTPSEEPTEQGEVEQVIEVLSVGFAAENGFIIVRFIAPPKEAEKWWQGSVIVIDEGNGAQYNEIPVMPKIGPLIGRPKQYGQIGYVMLVNTPPYLQPGARVTVKLGNYTFEHLTVQ